MINNKNKPGFSIRTVKPSDIHQLVELEKEWPEDARATQQELQNRIDKFRQGFFIAENETGIIASIISYPYHYQPGDLSNFASWEMVAAKCYHTHELPADANALYILSGTSKPGYGSDLFDGGVNHVVDLGREMGKHYIIGGCLLPGYARYISKHEPISAGDYVFKKSQGRYIDPLIEKYRRLAFYVPDKNHVIANYFPHAPSLNYSALVVRDLSR
jgi:hypothetical protein